MKRRIEIYAAIGSVRRAKDVFKMMLMHGMTGVCIDLHGEHLYESIKNLRGASEEMHMIPDMIAALPPGDRISLQSLKSYPLTGILCPASNQDDLVSVKKTLHENHLGHLETFAEIRDMEGIRQLHSLLHHCGHIVLNRDMLRTSLPFTEFPAVQKKVCLLCAQTRVSLTIAGELLPSISLYPQPGLAETNDIFHMVLDGAHSFLLTGQEAAVPHPEKTIKALGDIALEAVRRSRLR